MAIVIGSNDELIELSKFSVAKKLNTNDDFQDAVPKYLEEKKEKDEPH
jgi:hypothetical protein